MFEIQNTYLKYGDIFICVCFIRQVLINRKLFFEII